jgi:hypothetical protein
LYFWPKFGMFLAVNHLVAGLHFVPPDDQAVSDCAPDVEGHTALLVVALNARPLFDPADAACQFKKSLVDLALHLQVIVEPRLAVVVDAGYVVPLGPGLDHGAQLIRAQTAADIRRSIPVAALTHPGEIIECNAVA